MAKLTGSVVTGKKKNVVFEKIQARLLELEKRKLQVSQKGAKKAEYFVFRLAGMLFAIDFCFVGTSASKYFLTRLFRMPPQLAGIFSHEGEILALFHLDLLMGLPQTGGSFLVMLESPALKVGILVDEIELPMELNPPVVVGGIGAGEKVPAFVDGYLPLEGKKIFHLDVEALLKSEKVWI